MASRLTRHAWAARLANLCLALLLIIGAFPQGAVAAAQPQEVLRGFYQVLLGNMRDGDVLGESGRLARLAPLVDRDFDIPTMTRLAVGASWANIGPTEQQRLIAAFGHYVAATYADQFDSYSGQQLQVTGERPYGSDVMVETRIVKANGETTRLDYLMPGFGRPDLGRVSRRLDQSAGSPPLGVPFDTPAGGRRRPRDGSEPKGRSAAERSQGIVAL